MDITLKSMKMSKKVLSTVIVLMVVLAGGATAFLATSDFGEELMGRLSRGVSSRESRPTRDRSAERDQSEESEAALTGSWWCAEEPKDYGSEAAEETTGEDSESSSDYSDFFDEDGPKLLIKPVQIFEKSDAFNWRIPTIADFNYFTPPSDTPSDPPELEKKPGEEESETIVNFNCMCGDTLEHYKTTAENLSNNYEGSTDKYCEDFVNTLYECQPKTTISCVCQDPDNPEVKEVSETVLNEQYSGDAQSYCDDLVSPVYCKAKYTNCEWGFDNDGVQDLCEETYKKMKVAQCAGEEYQPDPEVLEVCEDSSNDMPYLLEAACVTEEECETYSEMFDSMGCFLNDYLEDAGVGEGVDTTCYYLYGIDVPIGGKGCGNY
jgi:hypothetical protein